jgi:hypothetical protein
MAKPRDVSKVIVKALLVLWAVLLIPIGTATAAVQVKLPDCGAIDLWSARVNVTDTYNVAPKLPLPKAFQDAELVPVFGISVLAWNQEDVQAVSRSLVTCYQEANKNHDATTAGALANANRALLGLVPRTNAALQKAKSDAAAAKQQIDALPDSAELGSAIEILLHANPAAPDINAYRAIPRPVGEPIWRLALAVLNLADSDREPLYKALGERGGKIQAGMSGEAEKAIAAAPENAAGVIALMEVRQKALGIGDADIRVKLTKSADDRAQHIRDALRQAKPALWVPPSCLELYRWSGAPNATVGVPIAGRAVMTAFLDERTVPVFGLSVSDWSDEDIARFKALRDLCRSVSQPQPGVAANASPEATELAQAAGRGRWIDGADQQIADARTTLAAYHKAQQALAADLAKAAALPDTAASLLPLAQIAVDPAQTAVSQEERVKFVNAVNEKRAAIGAHATDAAVKGLDSVKVATLADLPKFFTYVAQVVPTIPDPRGQQAFGAAANHSLEEGMTRLMPEFQAKLAAMPADFEGAAQAKTAVAKLTGIPDASAGRLPAFKPLYDAARARSDAIGKSMRDQACGDLLSSAGVGSDAKQDVWDGEKGMSLGDFICGLATHGYAINSYAGSGLLSSTSTLKVTPPKDSIEIISMHPAEVTGGKSMLVGFKVVDANGQQVSVLGATGDAKGDAALSTFGWEFYAKAAKGPNPLEDQACDANLALPAAKLGPADKLFRLECQTLPSVMRRAIEQGK